MGCDLLGLLVKDMVDTKFSPADLKNLQIFGIPRSLCFKNISSFFLGCECFFLRVTKVWMYYKVPVAQYCRSASALKPLQNGTPVQDHAAMPPPIAASIPARKDEVAPAAPLISEAKVTPKVDLVPQQSMLENANLLDQELQEAKDSACCPAKLQKKKPKQNQKSNLQ